MSETAYVYTASGSMLDLLNPKPLDFRIEDIAHHLAMQPRYAGATKFPYSVAQHSVLVARACPPEYTLWGLLHDASEAFLCDLVSPIKRHLREYVEVENSIMYAISERFGLTWPEPPEVKACDQVVAKIEMRCLLRGQKPKEGECIPELTWREARDEYLEVFGKYRMGSAEILRLLRMCRWRLLGNNAGHVVYEDEMSTQVVTLTHPARDVPQNVVSNICQMLQVQSEIKSVAE